jgi:DTW domain-containing protein YfiP
MKIFLLTHERELHRTTNTGSLALGDSNNIVERVLWERVNPSKDLTRLIENNEAVLLYSKGKLSSGRSSDIPSKLTPEIWSATSPTTSPVIIEDYENIIIIDSTWQEARKIFNHSHYLQNAPQVTLKTTNDSLYKLRANQPKGGLCTIECIIEVLRLKGQDKVASELSLKFDLFNG